MTLETRTFPERQAARFRPGEVPDAEGGEPAAGSLVGRYVILELLGSGGMGRVYSAYDPELDRKVAVKLLHRDEGVAGTGEHLRAEGRAMAKLAHPNVVAVFDVGLFNGRMFVAMEYIPGDTLSRWLASEEPSWKEILKVFLQAGAGLAAAHQVGIVHQDFKPSNVMLTPEGSVRVVDFGLARRLHGRGGASPITPKGSPAAGAPAAASGKVAGTPGYIAPERWAGLPADAKTDQYSFCVALGRALGIGVADSGTESGGREDPGAKERRRIPRWLRQAVERGCEPEPNDRFESMDDLLVEISLDRRRRRTRWRLTMLGFALPLIAGWLSLESLDARGQMCTGSASRLETAWSPGIRAQIRSAFVATGLPFAEQTFQQVEQATDDYAKEWQATYKEACRATRVFGDQSERLLDLRMFCLSSRLGELRELTGLLAGADRELVYRAVEGVTGLTPAAACSAGRSLSREPALPEDLGHRRRLQEAGIEVGHARNLVRMGRHVDVERAELSITLARELKYPPLEAEALVVLAKLQEDPTVAEGLLKEALRAAVAADSRRLERRVYAELAHQVGVIQSRFEEARTFGELGRAAQSSDGDEEAMTEIELIITLGNLHHQEGRMADARELYREARGVAEERGLDRNVRLANLYSNLAMVAGSDPADQVEALANLTLSLEMHESTLGAHSPKLGPTLINLASYHAQSGRYEEAVRLARRCLDIQKSFFGRDHRDMSFPLILLGQVLTAADRPEEALSPLRRSLPLVAEGFGQDSFQAAQVHLALGEALLVQEDGRQEAQQHLQRARSIYRQRAPGNDGFFLALQLHTGELLLAQGKPREAIDALEQGLSAVPTGLAAQRDLWRVTIALGEARLSTGERVAAREHLERAVAETRPGVASPHLVARAHLALAWLLWDEDADRADELMSSAREFIAAVDGHSARRLGRRLAEWPTPGERL